jgi:hypothetical protein
MGAITRGIANNILGNGAVDGTDALTGTIPATNIGNPSLANLTTFPPSVDAGIPQVAGDPPAPSDGDVWYNTNTYKLKVRGLGVGSWATGGNLNQFRDQAAGSGTQTSTLVFGGGPPALGNTESYNGSAWTEVNDLNTARRGLMGAGVDNTSALAFSGINPPSTTTNTELWDGTNWTEVNNTNTYRGFGGGTGISTSALFFGGGTAPDGGTPLVGNTESWNGTSWTEVNDLNTGRSSLAGSGADNTSVLAFGGNAPPFVANTESWNGTSWTEVNDLNTARYAHGAAGVDNTSAIAFGGYTGSPSGITEEWNGTSWTEVADMATARNYIAGSGTKIAALASGGSDNTNTEEFTKPESNLNVDLA